MPKSSKLPVETSTSTERLKPTFWIVLVHGRFTTTWLPLHPSTPSASCQLPPSRPPCGPPVSPLLLTYKGFRSRNHRPGLAWSASMMPKTLSLRLPRSRFHSFRLAWIASLSWAFLTCMPNQETSIQNTNSPTTKIGNQIDPGFPDFIPGATRRPCFPSWRCPRWLRSNPSAPGP